MLSIFLLFPNLCLSVCPDTNKCIARIRQLTADSRRFWFGDRWKDRCMRRDRDPIECYNPYQLQSFHNIGSRLFRVRTYHSEFLQNLHIFPRVTYRIRPGSYRACDHNFFIDEDLNKQVLEVDPDMDPVEPFTTRYLPDIRWPNMDPNISYVIVIIDVGFSTLNYLAFDFPKNTKILRHYEVSENFRFSTNPIAILIFVQNPEMNFLSNNIFVSNLSELFDLPKFMLNNRLETNLVGMNVLLVTTDAFAIEKQRIRGIVDNCHALIERKLRFDDRWNFVKTFPLKEMDSWLSVDYFQPYSSIEFCCEKFQLKEATIPLDPLGDGTLASAAVHSEPRVSAMKIMQNSPNYQRNARDFLGFVPVDRRFTVVLFEPESEHLYWMVTDIPSTSLAASNIHDGTTVARYISPVPTIPRNCSYLVFMLFLQSHSSYSTTITMTYHTGHVLRSSLCYKNCPQRSGFDIEKFKSLHQLQISAINWMKVCYDVYEGSRQIAALLTSKSEGERLEINSYPKDQITSSKSLSDKEISSYTNVYRRYSAFYNEKQLNFEEQVCAKMGMPIRLICPKSGAFRSSTLCSAILLLFQFKTISLFV